MKILKLILKNFAAVENALESSEIELDFSKAKNKICLIIGPNGSGKTTILSMLHPFADIGNLDVRNGMKLILEGKEGYKELSISRNKHIYVIKHFYFPHKDKSHSVKSYIELDGEELNPNGNVTSFKEIIKTELQIEPDYLKLIRLGSNVTSLIDLSPTERKNFMSKIMDDIGIYLNYYKSVNSKLKHLDEIISHTIDKIKRLGILDKEQYKSEINKLKTNLDTLEKCYIASNNELAIYEKTISEIEDVDNLTLNVKEITKKYNKMTSILERKTTLDSMDVNFYKTEIDCMESKLSHNTNEISAYKLLIQNLLGQKNDLMEHLHTLEVQLHKEEESDMELVRMNENLNSMREKIKVYEKNIGDYRASYTLKELEDFIVFLKNMQQILSRTYEFGKAPIEKVVNLMSRQKNVLHYINTHLIDLDDKKNDATSVFLSTLFARTMLSPDHEIIISCKEECIAKNLYNQMVNLIKNSEVDDKSEDASFYRDMEFVYQNLKSVMDQFIEYKKIIHELPDKIKKDFSSEEVYRNIKKLKPIYDEKKMNELLSYATEYENYIVLVNQYEKEMDFFKKFNNFSNLGNIREQIIHFSNSIKDIEESMKEYKESTHLLEEENKELLRTVEVYSEIRETLERYDEIKELFEKLTENYKLYTNTSEKIYKLKIKISSQKSNIDKLNEEIQRKISNLNEYRKLNKELVKMNEKYDNFTLIKRSLSSKEGIPLYRMRMCLGNTESITNELLDIVYDGKISISEFNITPTEFSIPFFNNHILLPDVKLASQGELSFINIALSFALSSQVLSKYNIMLLDEIDGPLDTSNREKFIKILENQIKRIDSEQNFLITHNAMFSSYPVDIIDLSFLNDSEEFPLANFIPIKRK